MLRTTVSTHVGSLVVLCAFVSLTAQEDHDPESPDQADRGPVHPGLEDSVTG